MWLLVTGCQWIRHLWYPKLFLGYYSAVWGTHYSKVSECLYLQNALLSKVGLSLSLTSDIVSLQPRYLTHRTVIFQKKVQSEAWPGAHSSLTHRGVQKRAPGEAGPWADLYSVHLVVGKTNPSMWVTGVGDDTVGTLVLSPAWCAHLTSSLRDSPW